MDPPAHIFANRKTLDQFSPEQFIGKALVVDCRDLKEGQAITIDKINIILVGTNISKTKLTLMTFLIIQGNFKGIGFDVMGLDPLRDNNLNRHKALFKDTDIVNIENLTNLDQCGDELFWFSCFPLKIENCDGFPIRAIAWYE